MISSKPCLFVDENIPCECDNSSEFPCFHVENLNIYIYIYDSINTPHFLIVGPNGD